MGIVHHLLRPDERLIVECFAELVRFRQSYDPLILATLRSRLAPRFGRASEAILSQALLVDQLLTAGLSADPEDRSGRRTASDAELRLLALIEAAQSSRSRLEILLLRETGEFDAGQGYILVRFAALLTADGVSLPRREDHGLQPPVRQRPALKPVYGKRAV